MKSLVLTNTSLTVELPSRLTFSPFHAELMIGRTGVGMHCLVDVRTLNSRILPERPNDAINVNLSAKRRFLVSFSLGRKHLITDLKDHSQTLCTFDRKIGDVIPFKDDVIYEDPVVKLDQFFVTVDNDELKLYHVFESVLLIYLMLGRSEGGIGVLYSSILFCCSKTMKEYCAV